MLTSDAHYWRAEAKHDLTRMLEAVKYEGRAKNVIIFVGDGMGIQTHTLARIYTRCSSSVMCCSERMSSVRVS